MRAVGSSQIRLANNLLAALVSSSVKCMHAWTRQARTHAACMAHDASPALPLLRAIGLANHVVNLCPPVR